MGGHPDTVALNDKGPFGLLACKIAKLPVSLDETQQLSEGIFSGMEKKKHKQLLHPRGTTAVGERLLGTPGKRLQSDKQGKSNMKGYFTKSVQERRGIY